MVILAEQRALCGPAAFLIKGLWQVIAVTFTLMQGAAQDPEIAKQRDILMRTGIERLFVALTLAVEEGELDAMPAAHDTIALLLGPLLHRTALQGGTVSAELIDRSIDSIGNWSELG